MSGRFTYVAAGIRYTFCAEGDATAADVLRFAAEHCFAKGLKPADVTVIDGDPLAFYRAFAAVRRG